jgi:hypothetical protein
MILDEWRKWADSQGLDERATGRDGSLFFTHLQRNHSHMLAFRCSGDKWQRVKAWLQNAGLVGD